MSAEESPAEERAANPLAPEDPAAESGNDGGADDEGGAHGRRPTFADFARTKLRKGAGWMHAGGGANAHRADEDMHEYQVHLLERATHDMGSWDDKQKNLAGARVLPKFHDKLREVSKKAGDLDAAEAGAHAGLHGRFLFTTFVVCVVCFGFPITSACGQKPSLSLDFLDTHWSFFVFCFPGCVMMFATVPAFAMTLAINLAKEGKSADTVLEREVQRKARNHDADHAGSTSFHEKLFSERVWTVLKPTLLMSLPCTVVAISMTIFLANSYFGFPVPFLPLIAGFPAYFISFPLTMLYMASHGYTGIIKECVKLFVLQVLILFMWIVYPTLAAMAKKYQGWEIFWAGLFPLVAMFTKWSLTKVFRKEWLASPGLAAPMLANHDIVSACLPACLLPSAVSLRAYIIVAIVSSFQQLWDLNDMWMPILKLLVGITKPNEQDTELQQMRQQISAAHLTESDLTKVDDDAFENDGSATTSSWNKRKLNAKAHAAQQKQEHVTVGHALQEEIRLESIIEDGELEEFREKLGAAETPEEAAHIEAALILFGHEHVLEREYQIVVTLVGEFFESFVPMLVLCLEFFLRYGWNRDVAPAVSRNLTEEEFWGSIGAKLCYIAVQLASAALTGVIVSTCTELRALPVLSYILEQHFEVLIVGVAGGLVVSFCCSIPHYNFNINIFVDEGIGGGFSWLWDAVGNVDRALPVNGCLDDGMGGGGSY